jgi:hypothetical protein
MKILTTDAQNDRDDFNRKYKDGGCSCCVSPPCGYCVHEGNPNNQAEDPECWQEIGYDQM